MPEEKLTKKQRDMLDFITEYIVTHDYSPSYQEIAEYFGLSSRATVYQHIQALEDKGYVRAPDKKARSLELVEEVSRIRPSLELPLVGLITAGEPIEAVEQRETVSVPSDLIRTMNAFVLKVRGDSMVEDGILDGDYVIAERDYYPQDGDVVVALLNNEYATLKRYYREKHRIRLQPANSKYKPIYATNPSIQGIVRAVFRKFTREKIQFGANLSYT